MTKDGICRLGYITVLKLALRYLRSGRNYVVSEMSPVVGPGLFVYMMMCIYNWVPVGTFLWWCQRGTPLLRGDPSAAWGLAPVFSDVRVSFAARWGAGLYEFALHISDLLGPTKVLADVSNSDLEQVGFWGASCKLPPSLVWLKMRMAKCRRV